MLYGITAAAMCIQGAVWHELPYVRFSKGHAAIAKGRYSRKYEDVSATDTYAFAYCLMGISYYPPSCNQGKKHTAVFWLIAGADTD